MTTQTKAQTAYIGIQTLTWDESEILRELAQDLIEQGEAPDFDTAFERVCEDPYIFESDFECFLSDFWEILQDISPDGYFHVEGRNMGWRHLSGHADVKVNSAIDYIERTFPKTSDWTLRGSYDPSQKCLSYSLSHHDAPTGEFYEVTAGDPDEDA
jgi:hypothetical protein